MPYSLLLPCVWRLCIGNKMETQMQSQLQQAVLLSDGAPQQRMKCILMLCWRPVLGTGVY